MRKYRLLIFAVHALACTLLFSCGGGRDNVNDEQIRVSDNFADSLADLPDSLVMNVIADNVPLQDIPSEPKRVVLTGMSEHRLVTVYKIVPKEKRGVKSYDSYDYSYYDGEYDSEFESRYMPGIDLIHGYNLLNVAHYNLQSRKLNFLFDHPVLVKSLYYPSFVADSIDKKPIFRDYYLVSVYDADTNRDTLINNKDLRRFYHFDAEASTRTQLIPPGYSVIRSQYDKRNDVMYVYARHDSNGNGVSDEKEPVHIFWFSLRAPAVATRLY